MSTAEILSLISTISFVIAAVSFVLALFFWFYFKIPSVIGDLSGRTAKKSIARMRASNENAGGRGYKPSSTNVNRGKLTGTMQQAGPVAGAAKKQAAAEPKRKASTSESRRKASAAEPVRNQASDAMPETGLLAANQAADVAGQQTGTLERAEETGLLEDANATMPLHITSHVMSGGKRLRMLDEVMLIHTNEVIN